MAPGRRLPVQIQIRAAVMRLPMRVVGEFRVGPRLQVFLCIVASGFGWSADGRRRPLWALRDQVEDLVGWGYADVWWVSSLRARELGLCGDVVGIAIRTSNRVAIGYSVDHL